MRDLDSLKRLIPRGVRRSVRSAERLYHLRRAVRKIAALPHGEVPGPATLAELHLGWGNTDFSAALAYAELVARKAASSQGNILECGSGLTTLLLGLLAGRRGIGVWTLEDSPRWLERIDAVLRRFRVPGVHVFHAPLYDYGEFHWYDAPWERMPAQFDLVVCDGPRKNTPGGRYGLMPVVGERLREGSVILLDNASRPKEAEGLRRWQTERKISVTLEGPPGRQHAIIVLLDRSPSNRPVLPRR